MAALNRITYRSYLYTLHTHTINYMKLVGRVHCRLHNLIKLLVSWFPAVFVVSAVILLPPEAVFCFATHHCTLVCNATERLLFWAGTAIATKIVGFVSTLSCGDWRWNSIAIAAGFMANNDTENRRGNWAYLIIISRHHSFFQMIGIFIENWLI